MSTKTKYLVSLIYAALWLTLSLYFAIPWMYEVSSYVPFWLSLIAITGSALIPGLAMAFVNVSLLLDKRRELKTPPYTPPISIIVAAYNEEEYIEGTLNSIADQHYLADIELIVSDDGSTDGTRKIVERFRRRNKSGHIRVIICGPKKNGGKANALNIALRKASHEYVITVDADSDLHPGALNNLVFTLNALDDKHAAVAGSILCKNHDVSLITRLQYWDYMLGISGVKRAQSMYDGTMVAQGAFSIYRKSVLEEVGGWPDEVGEDIVLSWSILAKGYSIYYSEKAICWTNVPEDYKSFFKQRKRWSRGLIEAFRKHPELLVRNDMHTFFVWYNLMFPYIDISFVTVFVPGVLAALIFGFYLLAGKMTLLLLPITFIYNLIILQIQKKEMKGLGITLDRKRGYFIYIMFYQLFMNPATITGYAAELTRRKKTW